MNDIEEIDPLELYYFDGVGKFKSTRRAIKRGLMTPTGYTIPNKPFHNRKNSSKRKGKHSRGFNEEKKRIYNTLMEDDD